MSELVTTPHVPTKEQITKLQKEMSSLEQVELPTEHYFSGGVYCRKMTQPAGVLVVGKVHKKDHFFVCTEGEVIAWSEKGMVTLRAGDIIQSKAGTKRAILAVQHSVVTTFHQTDKTTVEEAEADLVEPDETALFDAFNNLRLESGVAK
jgi:mannose-6-phosphate isomerase-like protein (cupin superfamily)